MRDFSMAMLGILRCVEDGGAYQLKNEPRNILTVLSGLTELNRKLEMLELKKKGQELTYVL